MDSDESEKYTSEGQGQRIRPIDEPSETLRATYSDYYTVFPTLKAGHDTMPSIQSETTVRRLTELECERLQGYPDGWTDGQTGSARYRQLGNSVAVPVVEWIARRLVDVDRTNRCVIGIEENHV